MGAKWTSSFARPPKSRRLTRDPPRGHRDVAPLLLLAVVVLPVDLLCSLALRAALSPASPLRSRVRCVLRPRRFCQARASWRRTARPFLLGASRDLCRARVVPR